MQDLYHQQYELICLGPRFPTQKTYLAEATGVRSGFNLTVKSAIGLGCRVLVYVA